MVVMGGIVGSGIFVTPAIVASWTSTRKEMIGAWIAGGAAALLGALIAAGLTGAPSAEQEAVKGGTSFVAALVPVLFSYGGFQTACFVAGEMKDPGRDLPRALVAGVLGVIVLYVGVAFACDRVLGKAALENSAAPAMDVATRVIGARGAALIGAGVAISSLGFLSQSILTAPRVYFAMAEDGAFLRSLARVHPRTRAPVAAIALQGTVATALALAGPYEVLLRYVVLIDFII